MLLFVGTSKTALMSVGGLSGNWQTRKSLEDASIGSAPTMIGIVVVDCTVGLAKMLIEVKKISTKTAMPNTVAAGLMLVVVVTGGLGALIDSIPCGRLVHVPHLAATERHREDLVGQTAWLQQQQ